MRTFVLVLVIIVIIILCWVILTPKVSADVFPAQRQYEIFPNSGEKRFESYLNIRSQLQTGDIIMFACNQEHTDALTLKRLAYNIFVCDYLHVGLVYRVHSELYLVECCTQDQSKGLSSFLNSKGQGGIRITEMSVALAAYVDEYSGYFAVKHISKPIPNHIFQACLNAFRDTTFESYSKLAFMSLTDKISHSLASGLAKPNGRMSCGEFLHCILHQCGILANFPSKIFWPFYVNDLNFHKLTLVPYSLPVAFLF